MLHLDWSATPAAGSALVQLGSTDTDLYVDRCHVTAAGVVDFAWFPGSPSAVDTASVTSFAPALTTTRAIGEAKVRIGATVSAAIPQR